MMDRGFRIVWIAFVLGLGATIVAPSYGWQLGQVMIPLTFIENRGQIPTPVTSPQQLCAYPCQPSQPVRYYIYHPNAMMFFTDRGMVLTVKGQATAGARSSHASIHVDVLGARTVQPQGIERQVTRVNYFTTANPARWASNLPTYGAIRYHQIYDGIDLVYRIERGRLKYEWVVHPGANPAIIQVGYQGIEGLSLDARGNLVIDTGLGTIVDSHPVVFQDIHGRRVDVAAAFQITKPQDTTYPGSRLSFHIAGPYDPRFPLIIDPGLQFSTALGAIGGSRSRNVLLDRNGNPVILGTTTSSIFPTTPGAFDTMLSDPDPMGLLENTDIVITKFTADGTELLFSTFLGGGRGDDGLGMAIDSDGNLVIAGFTSSHDFPTTPGAFDTTFQDTPDTFLGDAFVTKLSADGTELLFSTFLGGSEDDMATDIAVDADGSVIVTGNTASPDFPITPDVFDPEPNGSGDREVFVTRLAAGGSVLLFSTFLGPVGDFDAHASIALAPDGGVVVAANTGSPEFPTTSDAFDTTFDGNGRFGITDVGVAKLSADGRSLLFSTFLGGTATDEVSDLVLDDDGNIFVVGITRSPDYPTTSGAFDRTFIGGFCGEGEGFVTKLAADGRSLGFSTFLSGTERFNGPCPIIDRIGQSQFLSTRVAIALDAAGHPIVTGRTLMADFPTTSGALDRSFNSRFFLGIPQEDVFVTKLATDGSTVMDSTFLGGTEFDVSTGIAVDADGNVVVVGHTTSTDFPRTPGAFDTSSSFGGIFLTKLDLSPFEVDAPDLTGAITTLKMKTNKKGEEVLKFTIKVGNTGNRKAKEPFIVMAFLSADEAGNDADDLLLETWTIPQLRKGGIAQLKWKIRNFSPSPDQFLVVVLDAEDEIAEVDETNNVVSRQIPATP